MTHTPCTAHTLGGPTAAGQSTWARAVRRDRVLRRNAQPQAAWGPPSAGEGTRLNQAQVDPS